MSEHTPGPWAAEKVNERKIRQWSIRAQGAAPVISYELATLSGHDPVRDKANARLIAAAPELLEALRQAAMWLPILTHMSGLDADATEVELSEFSDGRPPVTISIASSLEAARAAIAKATQY